MKEDIFRESLYYFQNLGLQQKTFENGDMNK
jgi:hypothetical protein